MARYLRRAALILFGLVVLLVAIAGWTPQGRAAYNTALFITQVVPDLPELQWWQPEASRQRVEVMTPEGLRQADLYRPRGEGPFAGVVLFLGVAPAGPDDPRVVNLGEALARAGLVTLLYWSPEKMADRVHPPDIQNLVAAYRYLRDQPFVDPERMGFGGFCVGASFALMAAAHPEFREEVAFVNAFGPYYDLSSLLQAYGTRTRNTEAGPQPWEIDPLTVRVTSQMLLDALPLEERETVREALWSMGQVPEEVSPQGLAVFRILAGGTEEEVAIALETLPPAVLELSREASPSRYLEDVHAQVLLMHDRADNLVPAWESRLTYEALEPGSNVRYTEFSLFEHMDPTRELGRREMATELWKLFRHLYAIMRQAS